MSLDEKIGQMMQVDLNTVGSNPSILTTYFIGSVLSGGDADPAAGNSAMSWANTYDTMQVYALKTPLKIPMIYGIDAVHGHNNVLDATIFPHNIGMGCTRNPQLVKEAARVTAEEIAATGIDWTFAPCIAAPRDERWGRTYEGFGETAELAQLLGSAAVRGFQGDSLSGPTSILACAKHFLGDGGTTGGVDQGNVELDEASIRKIHLPGYISAIDSGVGSIMVSFNSINGQKMHGNKYWLTDVLKGELHFQGFVVSDWAAVDKLGTDYKQCVDSAVNAGIDMVMLPTRYDDFRTAMRSLVSEGKITTTRVDDAVRRILTAKFKLGLFERPYVDRSLLPLVGSAEHRTVARQCVRESIVLLKKKDGIVPLPKTNKRILVAGSNADDIGNQCGGWTIYWQGRSGNITTGTTILQGIKNIAPGNQIDYSKTGDFTDSIADYSVVVIGESPYAEGTGDNNDLGLVKSDVELIKRMKSFGAPVIVILVSGRPLIIEKILHYTDVIFTAWLPGTEGEGVADVLFGDYQPKGILSCTWPKNMSQIPINVGDNIYDPLYPYGYGFPSLEDSPQGSAPVCLSAIITSDAKHFELTFNKKMKNPSTEQAAFTLILNQAPLASSTTVSLKENDSTTIIVTLDTTYYTRDDVGTISYNSGTLESIDGGLLQPFGPIDAYNWVRPAVVTIPARIEAENYSDMSGIQIEPTNDIDGVSDVTSIDDGDWLEYLVNVPVNNYYYLALRYASESAAGEVQFLISKTIGATMSLPATGSWNNWAIVQMRPPIYAGEQTIGIKINKGGFRLNWLSITVNPTSVNNQNLVPLTNILEQNFPNPFNLSTEINYSVKNDGIVRLNVFNLLGQEVKVLKNEHQPAGSYSIRFDASGLASGVYFCKLQTGNFSAVKKLLLMK
jgi:beta-glucosidase